MAINPSTRLKMVVTLAMPGLTVSQNVFYARYTGVADADEDDVVDDLAAWAEEMWLHMEDFIVTGVSISEITVSQQIGTFPLVFEEIGSTAGVFAGLSTETMVAHGVALVMRVATSGVGSISRKFLAGIADTNQSATGWFAGVVVGAVAFMVDWITGPDTVGARTYDGGIVSAKDGGWYQYDILGIVSTIQGYQRRRKPGVGI